ncbi:hypothetical protein [Yinghuangia sp. YIM S09857]|uniref:hypothetical protein n=1 Tax=Yinghuangia sp. YIM S09857 TaxID=3436929 RepID=UPI003F539BE4
MSGTTPPPGYAQAPPGAAYLVAHPGPFPGANSGRGKAVAIRIAWSLVPILSVGFLAWVPLLVLGLHRRTRQAWTVFTASVVLAVTAVVLLMVNGSEGEKAERARGEGAEVEGIASVPGNIGAGVMIALWVGGPVYWFVTTRRGSRAEIRGIPVQPVPMTGPGMPIAAYGWHGAPGVPHGGGVPSGHAVPGMPGVPAQSVPPAYRGDASVPAPGPAPVPPAAPPPVAARPDAVRVERARARLEGLSERLREREGGADPGAARPGAPD